LRVLLPSQVYVLPLLDCYQISDMPKIALDSEDVRAT
jgi:hypothetical protein